MVKRPVDNEGRVNYGGPKGGAKIVGSGIPRNFIGGEERNSGKKPMSGEAYSNEIDEPRFQKVDRKDVGPLSNLGMMQDCSDYKSEAAGQAYGQAGMMGCKMDNQRIHEQFRPVYSDDTGY